MTHGLKITEALTEHFPCEIQIHSLLGIAFHKLQYCIVWANFRPWGANEKGFHFSSWKFLPPFGVECRERERESLLWLCARCTQFAKDVSSASFNSMLQLSQVTEQPWRGASRMATTLITTTTRPTQRPSYPNSMAPTQRHKMVIQWWIMSSVQFVYGPSLPRCVITLPIQPPSAYPFIPINRLTVIK